MKHLFSIILAGSLSTAAAQNNWTFTTDAQVTPQGQRVIVPSQYKVAHASTHFHDILFSAPHETAVMLRDSRTFIELPLPNGTIEPFRVVESPCMAPELAAAFPSIRTFNVQSVNHPGVYGKLDWTDFGFHAMIRQAGEDFFIDPYARGNTSDYIVYNTKDFKKQNTFAEQTVLNANHNSVSSSENQRSEVCAGTQLRTYRLAVACTGEYAQAATGLSSPSTSQILSAVVTTVNRVDGVYETEVSVKLVLIVNDTILLFPDPMTDPFTGNDDAGILIGESQDVIDNMIGDAGYDIGHTFSTGGGGLAYLGCVCTSNIKASGITGSSVPVGDPYDIDYVAHEIGHQFGGNHTFAAETGACDGNGNPSTQVEPGSGITIMAYAGICSYNDLAPHSIPYFHAISFLEIMAYTTSGFGHLCPVVTATGNQVPVVTAPALRIVPKGTPFILTGSATDADGDSLTYQWEEVDYGWTGDWNTGSAPFFRSYTPTANPARMFPKLSVVLSGDHTGTIGEYLSSDPQTLTFKLNVRDNKMGGGGLCSANTDVQINAAGPFAVTYPNANGILWYSGSTQTVTWSVNGTNAPPVSCANVNILVSLDGGNTFTTLLAGTPNDGSQVITAPTVAVTNTNCRIKVESAGNIFFDINDHNFTISSDLAGIAETENVLFVETMPNPFNGELTVSLSGINQAEKTNLVLYDVLGHVVLRDGYTGQEKQSRTYDLSALGKGVYLMEISNKTQKRVMKVVKQ